MMYKSVCENNRWNDYKAVEFHEIQYKTHFDTYHNICFKITIPKPNRWEMR